MHHFAKAAAWLAAFTAALHLFGGTFEIQQPLLDSSIQRELKLLLYVCWHLVSVALAGSAIVLFMAAYSKEPSRWQLSVQFVAFLWLAFGGVFILVDLIFGGPPMLLRLPQWTLFAAVGGLAIAQNPKQNPKQSPSRKPDSGRLAP